MKNKTLKIIYLSLFWALIISAILEIALCFITGYAELWYTILFFSVISIIFAFFALKTKFKCLYICSSIVQIGAFIFFVAFPNYLTFAYLILGTASFLFELFLLIYNIVSKKTTKA